MNIAIFVSGKGSNMEAIINASKAGVIDAKVVLVLSNNPDARAVVIAKQHEIDVCVINHKFYPTREEYDKVILKNLALYDIDLICLAGFMRILTPYFIDNCTSPIINIHPSLLPDFKGANAVEDAYNAGVKTTGCTVHYVTEEVDSGEVIAQKSLEIDYNVSVEALKLRIHEIEHQAYIEAIQKLTQKNISIN